MAKRAARKGTRAGASPPKPAEPAPSAPSAEGVSYARPGWLTSLREDEDVAELIDGLALSARFHFYILVCDTPRVAGAVFKVMAEEVSARRDDTVRLVRLDPYQAPTDLTAPIAFDVLVDRVLSRLVAPKPNERAGDVIFIVDASRALPQDDAAWMLLFQRMNERRNVIAQQLRGPLVLSIPGRLEPVFAHAAPDFWSIRSLAVVVNSAAVHAVEPPAYWVKEPRQRYGAVGSEQARGMAEIQAGIHAARAELEKNPEDPSASQALIVWLDRQVEHELAWGALDRALPAAEESAELDRERLKRDPERAEWLRDLSVSLNKVGNVHRARGELDRALRAYDESLALARRLVERDPERAEWLRDLSVSLNKVGDVQRARGELDRALRAYEESLALARRLVERDPERAEWLRDLSASLDRVGDVQSARGELERALRAYDESLQLVRKLVQRDPAHPGFRHDLALTLIWHAQIAEAAGRPRDALSLLQEALAEFDGLVQRPQPLPAWQRDAASCRSEVARIEASLASPKAKRRRRR